MEKMKSNVLERVLVEGEVAAEESPKVEDVSSVDLEVGRVIRVVLARRPRRVLLVDGRQLGRERDCRGHEINESAAGLLRKSGRNTLTSVDLHPSR